MPSFFAKCKFDVHNLLSANWRQKLHDLSMQHCQHPSICSSPFLLFSGFALLRRAASSRIAWMMAGAWSLICSICSKSLKTPPGEALPRSRNPHAPARWPPPASGRDAGRSSCFGEPFPQNHQHHRLPARYQSASGAALEVRRAFCRVCRWPAKAGLPHHDFDAGGGLSPPLNDLSCAGARAFGNIKNLIGNPT